MEDVIRNFIVYFTSILYEAMPFVVLGATIAGILEELTPRQSFAFMMGVSTFLLTVIFLPRSAVEGVGLLSPGTAPADGPDAPFLWLKVAGAGLLALGVFGLLLRVGHAIDGVLAALGGRPITAIAASGLLGLIMPMCECGIVPVMRRLLRKGMPLSCCTCYLLAGPIVNIVVLLSTYMAFNGMELAVDSAGKPAYQIGGIGMVLLRGGLGWLVAFITSLVVERQYRKYGDELLTPLAQTPKKAAEAEEDVPPAPKPWREKVSSISETALHDFVDIMVFLILGSLLSSTARVLIPSSTFEELSRNTPAIAILGMMALAVVLCLCSEADAFLAASLTALRPASKLAFLVLGPMMDFKLYMMYLRVFRPRLIWTIIPCVVVQVFVYTLLVHFLWETYAPRLLGPTSP